MNKEEFVKEIEKIEIAYKKKFNQEEYRLWFKEFETTNINEFKKSIERTIQEVKFLPKIAEVRARIAVNPNNYYINDPYRHLYKNNQWEQVKK